MLIPDEFACGPIQPAEATVRADPQLTGAVGEQRVDRIIREARSRSRVVAEMEHFPGRWIEAIEAPVLGTDPDRTIGLDEQGAYLIACDRGWSGGVVPVGLEAVSRAIPARHAATIRGDPEIAVRGLGDLPDEVVCEPVGPSLAALIAPHFVAVVTIETVLRAEPHVAHGILEHGHDVGLGQPLLDRDVAEAHRARVIRRGEAWRREKRQGRGDDQSREVLAALRCGQVLIGLRHDPVLSWGAPPQPLFNLVTNCRRSDAGSQAPEAPVTGVALSGLWLSGLTPGRPSG